MTITGDLFDPGKSNVLSKGGSADGDSVPWEPAKDPAGRKASTDGGSVPWEPAKDPAGREASADRDCARNDIGGGGCAPNDGGRGRGRGTFVFITEARERNKSKAPSKGGRLLELLGGLCKVEGACEPPPNARCELPNGCKSPVNERAIKSSNFAQSPILVIHIQLISPLFFINATLSRFISKK